MDFIVKLLKSKNPATEKKYDSILTTTDWLIKEVKFISINKATEASETVYLIIKEIVAIEELSDK